MEKWAILSCYLATKQLIHEDIYSGSIEGSELAPIGSGAIYVKVALVKLALLSRYLANE